jgi:hypothetical protein
MGYNILKKKNQILFWFYIFAYINH